MLSNLRAEFNIWHIAEFQDFLNAMHMEDNHLVKLNHEWEPLAKKFMSQALTHFNRVVVKREEQQMKLAVHFYKQNYV